jgi:hypothetical protein
VVSENGKGAAPGKSGGASGGHRKLSLALVALGTLFAVVAVFSIWANRQALNTDNWVRTSDRLLANHEVDSRLSAYLANEIFAHVDVKEEIEKELPPQLKALAGPAAGGLSQLAPKAAERLLSSPHVQALWSTANRTAHETLLKLLDGGAGAISTEGGAVSLDLNELLKEVAGQVGVGEDVVSKLPPEAGNLTILRSDQISTAQSIAKLIRALPIVLTLLTLILYAAAIWQAGPRRRQALRSVGLGLVVAGALVLLFRSLAGHALVNSLVKVEANKPAVEAVWSIGTSLLATVASSALAFGILVFLAAWLAGPTRLATALRSAAAPYVRDQPAAAALAAFLVWLALVAWVPIAAFRKPLGVLIFAILFAAGAELLRRRTLREFPDAEAGDPWGSLRSRFRSPGGAGGSPAGGEGAAPEPATEAGQLAQLSALYRQGDLTDAEFAAAKAAVIR